MRSHLHACASANLVGEELGELALVDPPADRPEQRARPISRGHDVLTNRLRKRFNERRDEFLAHAGNEFLEAARLEPRE